jgi:hypothetical protein
MKNMFTYKGICKICSPEKMGIGITTLKKGNVKIKRAARMDHPLHFIIS